MRETINFVPSKSTPNHKEVQYWIDLQTDHMVDVLKHGLDLNGVLLLIMI